jgi:hypothetical protein
MSGLRTPPDVVMNYDCRTCKSGYWIGQESLDKYECDGIPLNDMRPVNGIPTRCTACARITQAVHDLNNLVVQKPYLLTDGMAGAPALSPWETDNVKPKFDREVESLGDGMDKKERQEFLSNIVQSFCNTAGQALTEEEVYGDKCQNERDSRASTQVEDNASTGSADWDAKTEVDAQDGVIPEREGVYRADTLPCPRSPSDLWQKPAHGGWIHYD